MRTGARGGKNNTPLMAMKKAVDNFMATANAKDVDITRSYVEKKGDERIAELDKQKLEERLSAKDRKNHKTAIIAKKAR